MSSRHPRTFLDILRDRDKRRRTSTLTGSQASVQTGQRQFDEPTNTGLDTPYLLYDPTETPDPGDALVFLDELAEPVYAPQYATIEIILNEGGTPIQTGLKMDLTVDFAATVLSWSMLCDQAATARVDIWSDTYANFPPVVGDSMPGADADKPKVTAAAKATNNTSSWDKTAIAAGDVLRVNVDVNDVATRITVSLKVRRD